MWIVSWDLWTVHEQCILSPAQWTHVMLLFTHWKKKRKKKRKPENANFKHKCVSKLSLDGTHGTKLNSNLILIWNLIEFYLNYIYIYIYVHIWGLGLISFRTISVIGICINVTWLTHKHWIGMNENFKYYVFS